MVGDQDRFALQTVHQLNGFNHPGFGIPSLVEGMGLLAVESRLQLVQPLGLVGAVGNDEAAVVGSRRVELHAPELDHLGDQLPREHQLGIGSLQVDLAVVGAAVVGGYRPGQPEAPSHERIHGDGVDGVAPDDRGGRIVVPVPTHAEAAVDVVIPRQPAGLAVGVPRAARHTTQIEEHQSGPGQAQPNRCFSCQSSKQHCHFRRLLSRIQAPPPLTTGGSFEKNFQ